MRSTRQQIGELVLAVEHAGARQDAGERLLHQILCLLAGAGEGPRGPKQAVGVLGQRGGVERRHQIPNVSARVEHMTGWTVACECMTLRGATANGRLRGVRSPSGKMLSYGAPRKSSPEAPGRRSMSPTSKRAARARIARRIALGLAVCGAIAAPAAALASGAHVASTHIVT